MKTHTIMLNKRYPKEKVYYEHGSVATNYQDFVIRLPNGNTEYL